MTDAVFDIASIETRRSPAGRATRPLHAATLMLVRRDGPAPRVMMGRRHAGARFMPDRWVFPGGRCEPEDARGPAASELTPVTADLLSRAVARSAAATLPRALGLAAVRETWEETGLRLARAAPAPASPLPEPWAAFASDGRLPDLAALSFVGRAVTPPPLARRFDARFFQAEAEALADLDARPSPELDAVAWLTLAETRDVELPSVTRVVLKELALRLDDPARPPLFMRVVHGRRRVDPITALPPASN